MLSHKVQFQLFELRLPRPIIIIIIMAMQLHLRESPGASLYSFPVSINSGMVFLILDAWSSAVRCWRLVGRFSSVSKLPRGNCAAFFRCRRRSQKAQATAAIAMRPRGTLRPASTATHEADDRIEPGLVGEEELPPPLCFKNPASGMTVPCVNSNGSSYLQATDPLSAITLLQQYRVCEKL